MAGRVYVLNKRHAGTLPRIEAALEGFAASGEGKTYFQTYKLDGYRKLRPKELEAMDPYAAEVREQLRAKGP